MYEPTMSFWENIKNFKDKYILVLFIAGLLGLGPSTIKKVKNYIRFQKTLPALITKIDSVTKSLDLKIQKSRKFTEVSHAALRSLMDLKATGVVELNKEYVDVEIRRCTMFVNGEEQEAEWAFILSGHVEAYEAIYSPVWRGYHYVDKNGNIRQVEMLSYDSDYIKKFKNKE